MRYVFVCLVSLTGWSACTSRQEAGVALPQGSALDEYFSQSKPAIRRSFTDVPINPSAFCTPGPASNCGKEVIDFQRQLMTLDPIPIPQPNTEAPISAVQADRLYQRFATEYAGRAVLPVFRQLFARILLNKYGIGTGRDYQRMAYYAQELVESGSYDVVTQAVVLKRLKDHVPTAQFNQLAQAASINAHQYQPRQKYAFDQQLESLTNPGVDDLIFPADIRNRFKEEVRAENRTIQEAFAQIEQLQAGTIN